MSLRGEHADKAWCREEGAATHRPVLANADFYMSGSKELTQESVADLIALLDKVEKSVLIRCTAGADRSGLAAAPYLAAISKQGEELAERQISIRFGHLAPPMAGANAMDQALESLEPCLGFPDS